MSLPLWPIRTHAALGQVAQPLAPGDVRTFSEERRARRPWAGLGRSLPIFPSILSLAYLGIYCTMLFSTSFLPYVMDNNESFSSLWHAANLYNFGPSQSFGLADESFSPDPQAHPYVHTHQGNFPRVFAYVIYVLGARTIEAQIGITTLTVGFATILFAYRFFSRAAGPLLAFITCSILISDYIFYAQWNVVTYRVWHAFFVFSSLLCVYGLGTQRRRLWVALGVLNYMALFYFEYAFVAFVSVLAGSYAALVYWRSPRILARCWAVQVAGGAVSTVILIAQLIGYLGLQGLLTDAYITYVARNAAQDPQLLSQITQFYESHRVAFWYNFVDSTGLRTPAAFIGALFVSSFQIFTPLLTLIVLILVGGALLGQVSAARPVRSSGARFQARVARRILAALATRVSLQAAEMRRPRTRLNMMQRTLILQTKLFTLRLAASLEIPDDSPLHGRPQAEPPGRWRFADPVTVMRQMGAVWGRGARLLGAPRGQFLLRAIVLALALHVLLTVTLRDHAFEGLTTIAVGPVWQTGGWGTLAAAFGAIVLTGLLSELTGGWRRFAGLPQSRVALAIIFVLAIDYAVGHQSVLYQQPFSILWLDQLEARVPDVVARAALVTTVVLATTMVLIGTTGLVGRRAAREFTPAARYLACALIAYTCAYLLVPGYIYSGYLVRSAPLTVFLTDPLIGAAGYLVIRAAQRALRRIQVRASLAGGRGYDPQPAGNASRAFGPIMLGSAATLVLAGGLTLYLSGFWVYLQSSYVELLPPTHFAFLTMLSQEPYRQSSFVVNQYAAPVAAFTGQWAYYDPKIGDGQVKFSDTGFDVGHDMETYLWLADRRENPAYARPQYFACLMPQSFDTVVHRLKPQLGIGVGSQCSTLGIVQLARGTLAGPMQPQVVAADAPPQDSWAILKLNWNYPPYLAPLSTSEHSTPWRVSIEQRAVAGARELSVRYQYAQQEGQPEAGSVIRLYSLGFDGRILCTLGETRTAEAFRLPASWRGMVRASVVPHTAATAGDEYFSAITYVGLLGVTPTSCT